jgi:hypothetical protein
MVIKGVTKFTKWHDEHNVVTFVALSVLCVQHQAM